MVTAEVEEVAVQETQPEVVPDTPEAPVTESPPEISDSDALKAFEAEIGVEAETQNETQAKGNDAGQNPVTDIDAEVARRLAEEKATADKLHQENTLRANFAARANNIRQVMTEVATGQRGVDARLIEWMVGQFNSHHADAQRFSREYETSRRDTEFFSKGKELAGLKADKFDSPEAFIKALAEQSRDGFVSKKDHDAAVKAAGISAYNKLKASPAALRALLSQVEGSAGTGGGGVVDTRSDDARLADPNTPISEVMKIRARQKSSQGY